MQSWSEREIDELRALMEPGLAQDERFVDELRNFTAGRDVSPEFMSYLEANKPLMAAIEKRFRNDELGRLLADANLGEDDDWNPC